MTQPSTIYETIGHDKINELAETFYSKVSAYPNLTTISPIVLTERARKQKKVRTHFFGGAPLYMEGNGHPLKRIKQPSIDILPTPKDASLEDMDAYFDEIQILEFSRRMIFNRLTVTTHHMMNTPDDQKGESM